MSCGCTSGLGRWWPVKRVTGRRKQLLRCGPRCFLRPSVGKPGYPVCPPRSCKPTCEGLLRARQRAITQRDSGVERKAISRARRLGCPWARRVR